MEKTDMIYGTRAVIEAIHAGKEIEKVMIQSGEVKVNGEIETGVTTMFIEPTLDTGPILLQTETKIGETETAPQLMERLGVSGRPAMWGRRTGAIRA